VAASDGQRPTYPRARWKNIAVLGNKETMEAALAWYRARGAIRSPRSRTERKRSEGFFSGSAS
jgi:hypothetical protein